MEAMVLVAYLRDRAAKLREDADKLDQAAELLLLQAKEESNHKQATPPPAPAGAEWIPIGHAARLIGCSEATVESVAREEGVLDYWLRHTPREQPKLWLRLDQVEAFAEGYKGEATGEIVYQGGPRVERVQQLVPQAPEGYVTSKEAAEILGVSQSTLSTLVSRGDLVARRLQGSKYGVRTYVERASVQARAARRNQIHGVITLEERRHKAELAKAQAHQGGAEEPQGSQVSPTQAQEAAPEPSQDPQGEGIAGVVQGSQSPTQGGQEQPQDAKAEGQDEGIAVQGHKEPQATPGVDASESEAPAPKAAGGDQLLAAACKAVAQGDGELDAELARRREESRRQREQRHPGSYGGWGATGTHAPKPAPAAVPPKHEEPRQQGPHPAGDQPQGGEELPLQELLQRWPVSMAQVQAIVRQGWVRTGPGGGVLLQDVQWFEHEPGPCGLKEWRRTNRPKAGAPAHPST